MVVVKFLLHKTIVTLITGNCQGADVSEFIRFNGDTFVSVSIECIIKNKTWFKI